VLDVRESYEDIGEALSRGERLSRYPARVASPAEALSRFAGNGIASVTFETERLDAVVLPVGADEPAHTEGPRLATPLAADRPPRPAAYGAVSGLVETLTRRTALRFVLYEGLVTRDPVSGRPLSVRHITKITRRPEHDFLSRRT